MTLLRTQLRHLGALLIACAVAVAACLPKPPLSELLIAEDGDLVAMARNGQLQSNRERPSDFIFQQWQRALDISATTPPLMLPPDGSTPPHRARGSPRLTLDDKTKGILQQAMERALDSVPDGRFACHEKDWCTALLDNGAVLTTISDPAYLGAACDSADIVVIPIRLRLDRCRSGATLHTAASLRRTGSVELDLNTSPPGVVTSFDGLDRPWNRHRSYDWRSASFTSSPSATQSEALPQAASPISDSDE